MLREDSIVYIQQAFDLKQDFIALFTRLYLYAILRSIGEGEERTFDMNFGKSVVEEADGPLQSLVEAELKVFVHVLFNEYEEAARYAMTHEDIFTGGAAGNPIAMLFTFSCCLALFAQASLCQETKEARRLVKVAKTRHAIIKDWVKKGNPNVVHYDAILDAELSAHQGKIDQAEKDYRRAITLSARGGFLREAGLASERYARLLRYLHSPPQRKDALFHLDRAIDFYSSWESPKKVSMLKQLRSEAYAD